MTKFKIGDKVRVTKDQMWARNVNDELYKKGDIDVITEVDHGTEVFYRVGSRGSINWIDERDIELVNDKPEFKIGDVVKVKAIWTHLSGRNYKIANINESDTPGMYHLQTLEDNRTLFPSGINYNEPSIYFWDQESIEDGFELVEDEEMNNYEKLLKFVKENNLTIDDLNDVAENLDELENLESDIKDTKELIEETEEELQRLYEELSELEDERNELLN